MPKNNYIALGLLLSFAEVAHSQAQPSWSQSQKPFHLYGNTYYVGTRGLSAMLITSPQGHVLIDGTVSEGAKQIAKNIRALGFKIEDVKLILNSHVHYDHAGGIAELQRISGAAVAASAASAKVLMSGLLDRDDPQFGSLPRIARSTNVRVFKDGETQRVGSLAVTPHFTPGHTPGGTTWTWKSCEQARCLDMVYADSLSPVSAKGYLYTDPKRSPNGVKQLKASFDVIGDLPCDILITPHPDHVDVFGKLAMRERENGTDSFVDRHACHAYVDASREKLNERIAEETAKLPLPATNK